ncbi:ABC transporter ATP-binding protein [Hoyosella altamirensis]|uniref:Molybdate transport system ATP-binding protein n=1 Tax=Hoyosella altamirensis TaxID=616997 RepID=A0A839RKG4_9ACTN|nr:ABC transporter ATP-binding protein [Hoyosella altamirensis]MBB3036950.1 molybdate transport system ATP-binding protein [Hoyosella altamirensis]
MAPALTIRVRHRLLDVDLELPMDSAAPVTVLFGASGAGKTTLLRCVAGLEKPAPPSRIAFGPEVWNDGRHQVRPRHRRVGYLFQDHALFPHLSVDANVAYGLVGVPRGERRTRTNSALATAGATHLSGRATSELSGGEAQRVALARALAVDPRLLLLDEPLSALDGPTRARLRTELRSILVATGTPTLLVTHDRTEALALGDRIVVLVNGHVHQQGPVESVFSQPATPHVAEAVGVENVLPGTVEGNGDGVVHIRLSSGTLTALDPGDLVVGTRVLACIRAEDVALEATEPHRASPRNHIPALVRSVVSEGPLQRVELDAGVPLAAYITRPACEDLGLAPGSRVTAVMKATAVHVIARIEGE